ncbi:MAG: cytochrome c biogenesis protein CcsA [Firmicutes bacterium]|nr:cytochrome c biogenesis protein CcsA [Bacillota bacterium]
MKRDPLLYLGYAAYGLVAVALVLSFLVAPTERNMGDVQRIFYFHVASAWNAFLAFAVVAVAGALYLRTREKRWDLLAYSSAEVGVLFTTVVLLTGPIWAKFAWLTWWTWDPRLTTTLILWFIYLAYLVLRSSAEGNEAQARLSAVFGIIGFVDVPIVFVSARWWRSIHPTLIEAKQMRMEGTMVLAMLVSVIAFTALYAYLVAQRLRVERLAEEVAGLKETMRG